MAIVQLKKLTFCGLIAQKSAVLEALQNLGGCHLVTLNTKELTVPEIDGKISENTLHALQYLNRCAKKRHQVVSLKNFNLAKIVATTLELKKEIRDLVDERDAIIKRIKEIEPWGNFKLPDKAELGGLSLWFYIVPQRLLKKIPTEDLIWQVVHRSNLQNYVVVIAQDEPLAALMPVARTHTGTRSLDNLTQRLNYVELKLEDKQAERESMTRWISLITLQLTLAEDQTHLKAAHGMTLDQAGVFALQAWVNQAEVGKFEAFAQAHELALLVAEPDLTDNPPTLLENSPAIAGAEDLITFYQTPNYHSWDPSAIVFWSVALFFAMILSDAGYAMLFLAYLGAKWPSLNEGVGKRMRVLFLVTLIFSIIWGMMIGSYFGYIAHQGTLLGHFKILDLDDFDSMMLISIAVGVVHLTLSNLVMAYQRKGKITAFASLGWAAITLGGFGLWQAQALHIMLLEQASKGLLGLGMLGVLCCSGHEPIHKFSDVVSRLLEGLHSLTDITKIFGNTLSYMRLFALGLAGASLALTFNNLAMDIYKSLPGLGLLCSILVLILGHGLNIMLCLLSGVLHGLRLNFIEFFNWSLTEEGYPFRAFVKKDRLLK